MTRPSQPEAWWEKLRHVALPEYLSLIAAEDQATHIDSYAAFVLPGLVQTEAYARAVTLATATFLRSQKRVDQITQIRMSRQWHVLERDPPPTLRFVIDEAVLYRPIGGVHYLRDGLRHLLTLMDLPHITLRILPLFANSQLVCAEPGFCILSGPKLQVFTENTFGDKAQTDPIVLTQYQDFFEQLFDYALDVEQSHALIVRTIARLDADKPIQIRVASP